MTGIKLDLQNVPLVGRGAQMKQLAVLLERSATKLANHHDPIGIRSHQRQTLLIQGSLGTGKTYLMEQWIEQHQEQSSAVIFASGIFNAVQKHAIPYAAWTYALIDLIQQVASTNGRGTDNVSNGSFHYIVNQRIMATDLYALLDLMPQLAVYITVDDDGSSTSSSAWTESESLTASTHSSSNTFAATSVDRFAFLYCSLLACVGRCLQLSSKPFALWIDNLQWADDDSMELLRVILDNANDIGNLVLILSERADDAGDETQAARLLRESGDCDVDSYTDDASNDTTSSRIIMMFDNLSLDAVNELLSKLLELKPEDTVGLAQILHTKTLGNPLFLMQFLDLLQRKELLVYSLQEYKWTWPKKSELLQSLTHVADNVASLVVERIATLGETTRFLLHIASFLGYAFDQDDLAIVWQGMGAVLQVDKLLIEQMEQCASGMCRNQALLETKVIVVQQLQECVDMGLLAAQGDGWYSFTHNTVHTAFLEMADRRVEDVHACCTRDELAAIYLRLGYVILGLYRLRPERKCKLFAAVEVLNRGVDHLADCHSKLALAKLNVEAAEQAAKRSAFVHAADYLSVALRNICRTIHPWISDYELVLYLYRRSAEVEVVVGRHDKVKNATDAVLFNAKTDLEKIPSYTMLAKSLRIQNKLKESREVMLSALRLLGESFPRRPNMTSLFWSRNAASVLSTMSSNDLAQLPFIKPEADRYRMTLLGMLCVNSYLQSDHLFQTLAMRRALTRTAQLGLCKASPIIFAFYAQALTHEGKYAEAFRFGELAEQLSKRKSSKENRAIAIFFLVAFVDHLRKPFYQSLRLLEQGFDIGMSSGDPESAFICASTKLSFQDCSGNPLSVVMNDSASFFRQAQQCNQEYMTAEFLLVWQYAANLAGETDDPLAFDGRFMNEEELMSHILQAGGVPTLYMKKLQMLLYVFMGQWELAAKLISSMPFSFQRRLTGHYAYAIVCTFTAIIWYKEYSRIRSRKALFIGNVCRRILKKFVSLGCVNVTASLWFVEAQHAVATNGKLVDVKTSFEKAIAGLHRSGLRHLEAVACENFATIASSAGDQELASDNIRRSYHLYREWGAGAVLRRLSSSYGSLLGDIPSKVHSSRRNARRIMGDSSDDFGKFDPKSSWWSQTPAIGVDFET